MYLVHLPPCVVSLSLNPSIDFASLVLSSCSDYYSNGKIIRIYVKMKKGLRFNV